MDLQASAYAPPSPLVDTEILHYLEYGGGGKLERINGDVMDRDLFDHPLRTACIKHLL